jgi:hypothetical protein
MSHGHRCKQLEWELREGDLYRIRTTRTSDKISTVYYPDEDVAPKHMLKIQPIPMPSDHKRLPIAVSLAHRLEHNICKSICMSS